MRKHFFRFLQRISHFSLYLRNENWPNGTFRLGLPHIIFQPYQSFEPRNSIPPGGGGCEIDICAPRGLFCTKFKSEQLLFDAFFHVMRIFGSVEP